jgi:hypothetical protein
MLLDEIGVAEFTMPKTFTSRSTRSSDPTSRLINRNTFAAHSAAAFFATSIITCDDTFPLLKNFPSPSNGTHPDTYAIRSTTTTGL